MRHRRQFEPSDGLLYAFAMAMSGWIAIGLIVLAVRLFI